MEIVKRLKSSNLEEDFDFGFEDEYMNPKNNSKKRMFFILIILLIISIVSYFTFKEFQKKQQSPMQKNNPTTLPKPIDLPIPNKIIQATDYQSVPQASTEKKEKVTKEVLIYTEILAKEIILNPIQEIPEKTIEINKENNVKKALNEKSKTKVIKIKPRIITIKKGDTLASISKKYYGSSMRFKRIINANRNIKNSKSTLRIGQKVHVPR